jgi:hypothetical protein
LIATFAHQDAAEPFPFRTVKSTVRPVGVFAETVLTAGARVELAANATGVAAAATGRSTSKLRPGIAINDSFCVFRSSPSIPVSLKQLPFMSA